MGSSPVGSPMTLADLCDTCKVSRSPAPIQSLAHVKAYRAARPYSSTRIRLYSKGAIPT